MNSIKKRFELNPEMTPKQFSEAFISDTNDRFDVNEV